MATTALVLHLRSEAVLVCVCQDVTRPETRHCLLPTSVQTGKESSTRPARTGRVQEEQSGCRGLKKEQTVLAAGAAWPHTERTEVTGRQWWLFLSAPSSYSSRETGGLPIIGT